MSIICVGELLIDFISTDIGNNLVNSSNFVKKAGGAPANVAAVASRLGSKSYFCGKVGKDAFGSFLKQSLEYHNVDTSMLVEDSVHPTTLAFVSLEENGERDFSFVNGADRDLQLNEVDLNLIDESAVLHFGSATGLLEGNLRQTYKDLYNYSKEKGKFLSFDPNHRGAFWEGKDEEFKTLSLEFIKKADFLKVSEEELYLLSGIENIEDGVNLLHKTGAKTIAVTLGSKGTYLSNGKESRIVESIKINAIDTTGAGDAFVGAFLHYLQLEKLNIADFQILVNCVEKANKVAATVCTKMGAMEALDIIS